MFVAFFLFRHRKECLSLLDHYKFWQINYNVCFCGKRSVASEAYNTDSADLELCEAGSFLGTFDLNRVGCHIDLLNILLKAGSQEFPIMG